MKKLFAVVFLGLGILSTAANAAGSYVLNAVNSYNPFSPTGTAVLSGPVPTAGSATVDALGNVSTTGIAHSFVNANSTYNYTNGVWAAVVGGTSITHTETCTESAGTPCTGALSGLNGIWNSTQQSGGAASGACSASAFFPAGNCDRVSIAEVPGVSLTIVEQSEFAIAGLSSGFVYRFVGVPVPACADFAAQVNSGSSNNSIEAASQCTNFAAAVTLSIPVQPANGSASVNGANIIYTPNGGFVGTDTVGYVGSQGADSDAGVLTVTVADATPDSFVFNDQPNAAVSTVVTSNTITVAGITVPVAISISSLSTGEYSIDGGTFTAAAGTITNGQTVAVRQTTSAAFATPTDATLTIGGVADTFTATTLAADTTPDAFSFTDVVAAALNTFQTSNAITVAGINSPAAISVTGGEYSIAGGVFTAAAGTVNSGQSVAVRHTSSASNSTDTTTTLTIGGVAGTFTSVTVAAAGNPPLPGGSGALDGISLLALGLVGLLRRRKIPA
jgi:hypothetical protein